MSTQVMPDTCSLGVQWISAELGKVSLVLPFRFWNLNCLKCLIFIFCLYIVVFLVLNNAQFLSFFLFAFLCVNNCVLISDLMLQPYWKCNMLNTKRNYSCFNWMLYIFLKYIVLQVIWKTLLLYDTCFKTKVSMKKITVENMCFLKIYFGWIARAVASSVLYEYVAHVQIYA